MSRDNSSIDYFCIFAGGGVRGTAYVGVFKVLNELNINIKGLAGSSVGAIFAALYAVGHSHNEIEEIIFSLNYEIFRDLYLPFGRDFGICKGDNFLSWMKNTLEKKFYGEKHEEGKNPPITFQDVQKDIVIIATDITSAKFKEFSRYTTPDVEIAQAIRASISIPGFFRPVWDEGKCLVDGDIIKNLPLWITSKQAISDDCRVLEFRLDSSKENREIKNPFDYFNAVIDTSTNITTDFIIDLFGKNDRFDFIKINAGNTDIIDFSLSFEHKKFLVQKGVKTTLEYFTKTLLEKKKNFKRIYKELIILFKDLEIHIQKKNYKDAQVVMSNITVMISENRELINHIIYDKLFDFKKSFITSITTTVFLRRLVLKNQPEILVNLSDCINVLEKELQNIKAYMKCIKDFEEKQKYRVSL